MSAPQLCVVAGERPRDRKSKTTQPAAQNALAKRWRQDTPASDVARGARDVIPLMEGWVRVLEKQAGILPDRRAALIR